MLVTKLPLGDGQGTGAQSPALGGDVEAESWREAVRKSWAHREQWLGSLLHLAGLY